MTSFFAILKDMWAHLLHGNALQKLDRLVDSLEGYAKLAETRLEDTQASILNLHALRDSMNADLDRAYRAIHNISHLSA